MGDEEEDTRGMREEKGAAQQHAKNREKHTFGDSSPAENYVLYAAELKLMESNW